MVEDTRRERRITTDRSTIREWATEHELVPVRRTEGGQSATRFVPRSAVEEGDRMDWDEFHSDLGESNDVVVHEEGTEGHPLRIVDRDDAVSPTSIESEAIEESLVEGDVVTSEVTETRVVETTVVERAELESELIDTEVVDERVVDVELESRECTSCTLTPGETTGETDWFDADRYLDTRTGAETTDGSALDVTSAPYEPELEVEDRYRVTRELTERFTIETRIADTDVTEIDTIASDEIDVEGLQQSIVESGLFRREGESESEKESEREAQGRTEIVSEEDVETEFVEGDRIHTYVDRQVTVEDEVLDRKRLRAEVADVTEHELEVLESRGLETATTSELGAEGRMIEHDTGETAPARDTEAGAGRTGIGGEHRTAPMEDDEGKDVVDASGDEVGIVVEVDESAGVAYVDPHPGITDRIEAKLDWGDADEGDFRLRQERIERIEDDQVVLTEGTGMDEDEAA